MQTNPPNIPRPGDPILCRACGSPTRWVFIPDDAKRSRSMIQAILGAVLLVVGIVTLVVLIGFIIAPVGLYLLIVGLCGVGANRTVLECVGCRSRF